MYGVIVQYTVIQGGTDALFEVKENLGAGQPCVVVEVRTTLPLLCTTALHYAILHCTVLCTLH